MINNTSVAATAIYQPFHFVSLLSGKFVFMCLNVQQLQNGFLFFIISRPQIIHHKQSDADAQQ